MAHSSTKIQTKLPGKVGVSWYEVTELVVEVVLVVVSSPGPVLVDFSVSPVS